MDLLGDGFREMLRNLYNAGDSRYMSCVSRGGV